MAREPSPVLDSLVAGQEGISIQTPQQVSSTPPIYTDVVLYEQDHELRTPQGPEAQFCGLNTDTVSIPSISTYRGDSNVQVGVFLGTLADMFAFEDTAGYIDGSADSP